MKTDIFYNLLDGELEEVIVKNSQDEYLNKHKDSKNAEKKSYALLIWFLEFYGQKPFYKQYITEGDDDNSCDIIFSNKDTQGKEMYYIIQSKWRGIKKNDAEYNASEINAGEFKQTLNDFETLLRGDKKKGKNERFNQNYDDLLKHLKENGEAKFIFFSLDKHNPKIEDNIYSFNKSYSPQVSLEVIDIEKIKRDFIEFRFKQVKVNNPLEYKYIAEDSEMLIEIERFGEGIEPSLLGETSPNLAFKRDFLEMNGRAKAYIFVLRPKTVYQLFEKYKFGLFFKNVRNPLHESNYNQQIVNTLKTEPSSFWYFNNGITAITKIIPTVGVHAQSIKIQGLQVINGAQTVYSIYSAYKEASANERQFMDSDARIMFRLIRSSDEGFNMEITRYTNSQNPMYPRDFKANDEIQIRLQEESFKTNYWYERRRGEFRDGQKYYRKNGIVILENENIIAPYIAFYLQNPWIAYQNQQDFFISRQENASGIYEYIFNENTKYKDILASFLYFNLIMSQMDKVHGQDLIKFANYYLKSFALCNILLIKYLNSKYNIQESLNVSDYLIKAFEKKDSNDFNIFLKIFFFALRKMEIYIKSDDTKIHQSNIEKLFSTPFFYQKIRDEIESINLEVHEIEEISIDKMNEIIAYEDSITNILNS